MGASLTPEFSTIIGKCLGEHMKNKTSGGRVLIGRDTRCSGKMLECAFVAGIAMCGIDADIVGIIPSGGVSFLTQKLKYDFGVVITSSHNPPEFNGIKFFNAQGLKLSEIEEQEIEELISNYSEKINKNGNRIGEIAIKSELKTFYEDFLVENAKIDLSGKKIIIDCANGAGFEIANKIFSRLGAVVKCINCEQSGKDINNNCGAVYPSELAKVVKSDGADLGFALDGDADRLIVCSRFGEIVDGDDLLCAMAKQLKKENCLAGNCVVGTIMSNFGLEKELEKHNINLVRVDVGDRNVVECMKCNGYEFGGEQSGHTIYYKTLNTSDALLSALKVAELEIKTEKHIDELTGNFEKYHQIKKNINVPEQFKTRILSNSNLISEIEFCEQKLNESGRIVVRASGTEPIIRVMAEGENLSLVEDCVKRIEGCVLELF